MGCSFSPNQYYPPLQPPCEGPFEKVRLFVEATGSEVMLNLCADHKRNLLEPTREVRRDG